MVIKMENENITVLQPEDEVNSATVCGCEEELSVCNCENDEVVTVCEAENDVCEKESAQEKFARKCREVRNTCQTTAGRLVADWKEANGNPYIKQTCITQVDIYRNPDEETPIDSFRTEHTKSYSARSLAVLGAAAFVVACTVDSIVKKILK